MSISTLQDIAAATTSELRTVYAAVKPLTGPANGNVLIEGMVRAIEAEMTKREQPLVTLIGKHLTTGQDIIDLPYGTVFEAEGRRYAREFSLVQGGDVIVEINGTPKVTPVDDIKPDITFDAPFVVVLDPAAR